MSQSYCYNMQRTLLCCILLDFIVHILSLSTVPLHLNLKTVVVLHRHGDRSQISKTLSPRYPENQTHTNIWISKMILPESHEIMSKIGDIDKNLFDAKLTDEPISTDHLPPIETYAGWDRKNFPYGQLTQLGFQQLYSVGTALRSRYIDFLGRDLNDGKVPQDLIYARSTNFSRTIQSLKALLAGLFAVTANTDESIKKIFIDRKPSNEENMYSAADGPCNAMLQMKTRIQSNIPLVNFMSDYSEFESKVKADLGFVDSIAWVDLLEVLRCHLIHDIPLPPNITAAEIEKIDKLAAMQWGNQFNDVAYNRLAIGRYIREMMSMIDRSLSREVGQGSPFISSVFLYNYYLFS